MSERMKGEKSEVSSETKVKQLKVPSVQPSSGVEAPLLNISGIKNSQEKQYQLKIYNKDLMSPDLKLEDLNKGLGSSKMSVASSPSKVAKKIQIG